jgi:uncharacterized membrane protein
MKSARQRILRKVLSLLLILAMTMGTGPGVLLVNRPEMWLGIPLLYAWAILWYVVLVVIALTASVFLWKPEQRESK